MSLVRQKVRGQGFEARRGRRTDRGHALFFHEMHGPATPTPALTGDGRLIVFFPDTGLMAYDVEGKELWRTPLGPFRSIQGIAASPVIAGDRVILVIDTPEEAFVAAYDVESGKQSWRQERGRGVLGGYSTPVVWRAPDGQLQVIVAGARELTSYQAATGERIWWGAGITSYPMAPIFGSGDSVFTSEPLGVGWPPFSEPLTRFDSDGDGRIRVTDSAKDPSWFGSLRGIDQNAGNNDGFVTAEEYAKATSVQDGGMFRVRLGGRGDVLQSQVVWRVTRSIPNFSAPVLYRDTLYTVRKGIVAAFEPGSGKMLREERLGRALGEYYASPVAGNGKIYFASYEGVLTVVAAGVPWRVLSSADLQEAILATPAILDGRLLVRTAGRMICFGR